MGTFVDPFLDTGFKRIFGTEDVSNEILCAFLNALFAEDPVLRNITSVTYRPTERVREWTGGKTIAYDVHCTTSTGHRFIIEMQANDQVYFLKRAFYYVARAVADQGHKGKKGTHTVSGYGDVMIAEEPVVETYWNYDVIPVIGVFLSDFFIDGLDRKLVTRCRFMDEEDPKPVGDYIRMIFIQMPAFTKREDECESPFEQWMYNLKNMATMQTMAFTSHQDIFNRLANVASLTQLSPEERAQYDYDLKKARDYHAEMDTARIRGMEQGIAEGRARGIAEGIAEGRAKGRAEFSLEIAVKLIATGMPDETIANLTELSIDEIKALRDKQFAKNF